MSTAPGKITPFLMFTGRAQEAIDFYMEQFSDAWPRAALS